MVSPLIPAAVGGLVVLGLLWASFRNYRHKRTIDDLPTSKSQGVFIGLAELKGTAESETPLTSYLAGVRCVYYAWNIEEHWQRTVHETYTDSKGHVHSRTRTESGWKTVADGGEAQPFYLKDDTGVIRIVPEDAKITGTTAYNETFGRDNPVYFGKGPTGEIANSTHKRRFHETAIPLHTMLYILGQSRERQDTVAAEIAADKNNHMFLISTRTEKQISSGYGVWFGVFTILGLLAALGAAAGWSLLQGAGANPGAMPYIYSAVGFLAVLLVGWTWTVYNSLINLHHRVEQGWSQVDVQLKRRSDLIPNLVQAVEGYHTYESGTLEILTELRAQATATPPGAAGTDFKGLAPLLRISIERYPDLKANEPFLKLQHSLVDTEQRIALARDYFNDVATYYNTRLDIIPDRFVALIARLHPQMLLSASDFERAPVKVHLAS